MLLSEIFSLLKAGWTAISSNSEVGVLVASVEAFRSLVMMVMLIHVDEIDWGGCRNCCSASKIISRRLSHGSDQ